MGGLELCASCGALQSCGEASRLEVGNDGACGEDKCSIFRSVFTSALPKAHVALQLMPLCSDELSMGSQTQFVRQVKGKHL